ncbi:hypothetical protein PVK06_025101 [Gossypium arboreum]|uniref:Uncharacterized protein n=1 Tax=Gossypium arboreum TaxID=29729 RepID=A0ABR0PFH2_GOSAR|nr:hypothetical protein PVK06_025101 [Gossypium arboreum]
MVKTRLSGAKADKKIKSDHRPLSISFGKKEDSVSSRPFRVFSGWLSHESFSSLVNENWVGSELFGEVDP